MAENQAGDKTEDATPERLRKSREEGRLPQSKEVPSALMIAMLLIVLGASAMPMYSWMVTQAENGLAFEYPGTMNHDSMQGFLLEKGQSVLLALAPFFVAGVAVSVGASLLVGGWAFSPKAVGIKFERIDPVKGTKNLISARSFVELLVSIVKMVIVGWISWRFLSDKLEVLLTLRWDSPAGVVAATAKLVFGLLIRLTIAMVIVAGVDLLWQRWKYKRELRMTRKEVKDERKQYEASPEVRSRIRSIQMEMTKKRMMNDVPQADVIVTNPTHVAVALRYDPTTMAAPMVLAKGPDLLAQKIKEIAREHNIPIVHRPELARTLFGAVEPGRAIPEELFVAVAEILAMVYRMRSR